MRASISTLAAVLVIGAAPAVAQAPQPAIEKLEWMAGTWVHDEGRGRVLETWIGPGNGIMVAANLSTGPGGKKFFEFMRIAQTPAGLSFHASPGGRAPVEFPMKELGDRRVVFENSHHDFPQRIVYWRDGEHLMARIEGSAGGKERAEQWRFARAASGAPPAPR
jgi:hypothetical protein